MRWSEWVAIREALADRQPAGWQRELLQKMCDHFVTCERRAMDRREAGHNAQFWEGARDAYENAQSYCDTLLGAAEGGEARPRPSDRET